MILLFSSLIKAYNYEKFLAITKDGQQHWSKDITELADFSSGKVLVAGKNFSILYTATSRVVYNSVKSVKKIVQEF